MGCDRGDLRPLQTIRVFRVTAVAAHQSIIMPTRVCVDKTATVDIGASLTHARIEMHGRISTETGYGKVQASPLVINAIVHWPHQMPPVTRHWLRKIPESCQLATCQHRRWHHRVAILFPERLCGSSSLGESSKSLPLVDLLWGSDPAPSGMSAIHHIQDCVL